MRIWLAFGNPSINSLMNYIYVEEEGREIDIRYGEGKIYDNLKDWKDSFINDGILTFFPIDVKTIPDSKDEIKMIISKHYLEFDL